MWKLSAIFLLLQCATSVLGSNVGEYSVGSDFCYHDDEGCGPHTKEWPELCHIGTHQSPINIPPVLPTLEFVCLRLNNYKGSSFRIQNNGHSISFDFLGGNGANEDDQLFPFPDPLQVGNPVDKQVRNYKFASGHFHWGTADRLGSEHCVGLKCFSMELHLVHYLAEYGSQAEALESGDPNALTVVGVFIDADPLNRESNNPLSPIVKHISEVGIPDHANYTTVSEPFDLSGLMNQHFLIPEVYSYKGSLTTPGCNEQVNWFVLRNPALIPHKDIQTVRSLLEDSRGHILNENYRPMQSLNGRVVNLARFLMI